MSLTTQSSLRDFRSGPFRVVYDSNNQIVEIPAQSDYEGFLVKDFETKEVAQIRFLKKQTAETAAQVETRWREFLRLEDSDIFPNILNISRHDGMPFCITELPSGEPVQNFLKANGPIPTEVAALLIIDFVRSILEYGPSFYQKFAIAPQSIWVARTKGQPKIILGEISEISHQNPESHNIDLIIDLFKFLTGDPQDNYAFQELCNEMKNGPRTFEAIENSVVQYSWQFPAGNYWMGYNEPSTILEGINLPADEPIKDESIIIEKARRSLWPVLIASSVVTLSFLGFCFYTLHNDPDAIAKREFAPTPVFVATDPTPVVIQPKVRPTQVVAATPKKRSAAVVASASPKKVTRSIYSQTANEETPEATPYLKSLLSDTGTLFKDMISKPRSKWLINEDTQQDPDVFTDEDARTLAALKIKKASAEALANKQTFTAVKHEVELLKLLPQSVEARVRLHDYLSMVEKEIQHRSISEEEIQILFEASTENAKAKEILKTHFAQG